MNSTDKTEDWKLNSAHSKREGWEEAAVKASLRFDAHPVNTYLIAIDDFKSALRKEIENERQQASLSGSSVTFKQGYVEALTYTLDLLDSVTPPKQ